MSIQRVEQERFLEALRALATTARSLKLAAQVFRDFQQYAEENWGADCYGCFDWIALSRRMFWHAKRSLDDLRSNYLQEFDSSDASLTWSFEQILSVTDRMWFERRSAQEITTTVCSVVDRLERLLAVTVAGIHESESQNRAPVSGVAEAVSALHIVQMVLQKPRTSAQILADPSASHWIKSALRTALSRDPVDAANDAAALADALDAHSKSVLNHAVPAGSENSVAVL